jgi:hypothetical protein
MCALLVTATYGCDRVKTQAAALGKSLQEKVELARERFFHKKPAPATPTPAAAPGPVATTPAKPGPAAPPAKPAPAPHQPAPQESQAIALSPPHMRDEPYVSEDTGTVAPGMSEKNVYSLWGPPVAVRRMGQFTYIYFKNGCEYTCGHLDVVTLDNGQVVDAIVRWPGHNYSGQSSSPTSTTPHGPPPGGDNLKVKRDTT